MKLLGKFVVGGALALVAGVAVAADAGALVKAREDNFKGMGKAMKAIGEELKAPAPAAAVLKTNAATIAQNAHRVAGMFPKGSGPESGVKTHALPAIWEKPADFRKRADDLVAAAEGLKLAAGTGNPAAVREAQMKVGGTCKACHQDFKARD